MWFLESGKHKHTHSPHSLARVPFSFTCSQQLPASTRRAESSAGVAHSHLLLPLTTIPLCNIIPGFWTQYYNPHSKIFLRRTMKPILTKRQFNKATLTTLWDLSLQFLVIWYIKLQLSRKECIYLHVSNHSSSTSKISKVLHMSLFFCHF